MTTPEPLRPSLRLLFVSDHLGHAGGTVHGATTYFLSVLPRLREQGIALYPCFLGRPHPAEAQLRAAGVVPVFLGRMKWDPRALGDITRLIRQHQINLVHAAAMKGIILARLAGRRTGTPVISHFHDEKPVNAAIGFLQRHTARWSTASIAISASVADFAVNELGADREQIHVLHNGIDPARAQAAEPGAEARIRQELDIPPDAPVVSVIGRLSPEKGQAEFIKTLPDLLQRTPHTHILIVGEGDERARCQALTTQLGIGHAVHFTGFRSDLADILAATTIVAIPSISEGLSYTALEAMAAGRPVIAMAVGGIPEIVHDESTGLLITKGQHAAFPAAIARVLGDVELQRTLIDGGKQLADQLSVDAHVAKLTEFYAEIAAPGGAEKP